MKTTKSIGTVGLIVALVSVLLLAGCMGDGSEGTEETKELAISGFSYAEAISGYDDYTSAESTYGPQEQVLIYFEVDGLEANEAGEAELREDLVVTGPEGDTILDTTPVYDSLSQTSNIYLRNTITPPEGGFTAGEHEVEITIADKVANETTTYTETFTVE